ncbi:MAG TPA: hypothetical protein VFD92_04835 [Candidatus Binatia bacterium]|nr:hypothetical protein [Candidatus Binatia bacterium]
MRTSEGWVTFLDDHRKPMYAIPATSVTFVRDVTAQIATLAKVVSERMKLAEATPATEVPQ